MDGSSLRVWMAGAACVVCAATSTTAIATATCHIRNIIVLLICLLLHTIRNVEYSISLTTAEGNSWALGRANVSHACAQCSLHAINTAAAIVCNTSYFSSEPSVHAELSSPRPCSNFTQGKVIQIDKTGRNWTAYTEKPEIPTTTSSRMSG
jgi:hypothetical protein